MAADLDLDALMGDFAWDDNDVSSPARGTAPPVEFKEDVDRKLVDPALRYHADLPEPAKEEAKTKLVGQIRAMQLKKEEIETSRRRLSVSSADYPKLVAEFEKTDNTIKALEAEKEKFNGGLDADLGDLDDQLSGLMTAMAGGGSGLADVFDKCTKCYQAVAGADRVDFGEEPYHRRCLPKCFLCNKAIDPTTATLSDPSALHRSEELLAEIQHTRQEMEGLIAMKGNYGKRSTELENVKHEITVMRAQIARKERKYLELQQALMAYVPGHNSRKYHRECLVCAYPECTEHLDNDRFEIEKYGIVCMYHFYDSQGLICGSCENPIDTLAGEAYLTVRESSHHHEECFVCQFCKQPMKTFKEQDGKFYCTPCHLKVF